MPTVHMTVTVQVMVYARLVNWKQTERLGKQKPATVNVQNANARRCIQTPNGVNPQWEWNDAPQERAYGNFQTVKKGV